MSTHYSDALPADRTPRREPQPTNCPTCGGTGYGSERVNIGSGACITRLIPALRCQDCQGTGRGSHPEPESTPPPPARAALVTALDAGFARAEQILVSGDVAAMDGMWARMLADVEREVETLADALTA